jgi:hypothetical protein
MSALPFGQGARIFLYHTRSGTHQLAEKRIKPKDAVEILMSLSDSFKNETDRGVALAGSTFIELATENLLRAFLIDNASGKRIVDEMPSGHRLTLCHALGLITDNELSACKAIAKIRNEFAHEFQAKTFDDPHVRSLCDKLPSNIYQGLSAPDGSLKSLARWRFERAVYRTASHMHFKRPEFFERYRLRTMVVESPVEGNELLRNFTYYSPGHFEIGDDATRIWLATSRLQDHFAQLGGAARYQTWKLSDIPLYIGVTLASRLYGAFDQQSFISKDFLQAADHVLQSVNSDLEAIGSEFWHLSDLIEEYIGVVETKLATTDRSLSWEGFVQKFRAVNSSF